MLMKMREEIKFRDLNNAALCKMSLQVVFKERLGCNKRRRKRLEPVATALVLALVAIIVLAAKS